MSVIRDFSSRLRDAVLIEMRGKTPEQLQMLDLPDAAKLWDPDVCLMAAQKLGFTVRMEFDFPDL